MKVNRAGIEAMFQDDVEFRKTSIRNYVMDQENTYEDRLEVYLNTPEHLRYQDGWVFHHPNMKDEEWYQYDWWNRCQIVDLTDIPEGHDWGENEEKVKTWYTGCMDSGVWSFCFDW